MNITPSIRSITEYAMRLSEQDALEAVTDPYSFADRLAEQLRAAGVIVPNGNGNGSATHKIAKDHPLGFKAHARKAKAVKADKARVACHDCGKSFKTQGFLDRHTLTKHSRAKQATDIF